MTLDKVLFENLKKHGVWTGSVEALRFDGFTDALTYFLQTISKGELDKLGKVEIRGGDDAGMINIDLDASKFPISVQRFLEVCCDQLGDVGETYGIPRGKIKIRIYRNSNITKTRYFHTDGQTRQLKMFIYLSDVNEQSGPFSYVRGSHKWKLRKSISYFISILRRGFSADPNTYQFNVTGSEMLGPPGTVIISDQNGLHRGKPQVLGNDRTVLVFDFVS